MAVTLDAAQSDHYRSVGIDNEYTIVSGAFVLPLAEAPPTDAAELQDWTPFVVVQAHSPYRLRTFRYNAQKARTPPVLPAPVTQGAYTFLGGTVSLPHPSVQTDRSFTWDADVTYLFAEGCAHNANTGFVIGTSLDAFDIQLQNQNYQSYGDAPNNVRQSGVGPKSGWAIGKTIDLSNPMWNYAEPSYYPAQLLSAEMVGGPTAYPTITGFPVGNALTGAV